MTERICACCGNDYMVPKRGLTLHASPGPDDTTSVAISVTQSLSAEVKADLILGSVRFLFDIADTEGAGEIVRAKLHHAILKAGIRSKTSTDN